MATTNRIRVWVRALGGGCRVRVESVEDARWLLDRLTGTEAVVGLASVAMNRTEPGCMFEIPGSPHRTLATLEKTLAQIPGVQLMLEPESI